MISMMFHVCIVRLCSNQTNSSLIRSFEQRGSISSFSCIPRFARRDETLSAMGIRDAVCMM